MGQSGPIINSICFTFSGDHIVPNFEEIWPSNKDKIDKNKRHLIGSDYYLDAMQNNGLKGHIPQPDNFTTVGKLGIEINQYNCPIEVRDICLSCLTRV